MNTGLYGNEMDRLVLTPLEVRKRAARSIEKQITELSSRRVKRGVVANLSSSLEKLKESVNGGLPAIEIYGYVPKSKEEEEFKVMRHTSIRQTSLEPLQEMLGSSIADARRDVASFNLKKCLEVSIAYFTAVSPVAVLTTPNFFPFPHATRFDSGRNALLYETSMFAETGNTCVSTEVPQRRRDLLLGIDPKLMREVLEEYRSKMKWFKRRPSKEQRTIYRRFPNVRQTQKFIDKMERKLLIPYHP